MVESIDYEKSEALLSWDRGTIEAFYEDEDAWYYLADGREPWDMTVHYENRTDEPLPAAMEEGRVTLEDLDEFDIDYVVREKD